LIAAEWRISEDVSHPRKYYTLTSLGAAELRAQSEEWLTISGKLRAFLIRGDH
jgi:DNA-binding PadR family transcriptional regulator